jgi:integrase
VVAKKKGSGEGSITRHKKSGLYLARYWVETPTGPKHKAIFGKRREDVTAKLADALSDRNKGLVFDDENMTVSEYLERWLPDCVHDMVRGSTFSRDQYLVNNHVSPTLGRVNLKNLNARCSCKASTATASTRGSRLRRSGRSTTSCIRPSPRP